MHEHHTSFVKFRNVPPKAAAMVEALRGLGYTTETALADVVDNSISAGATRIEIDFYWQQDQSWIRVRDDGSGMTDAELESAMRLGDRNPLHHRRESDLGRFGLGLKTASFSQAKRLTVSSLKNGVVSCIRWDLDVLANDQEGNWHLLDGPHPGSESKLEFQVGCKSGTVVLWEIPDRIVSNAYKEQDFLDLIDKVERHLSMVFHRFLDGSGDRIVLVINDRKLKPWDPFLSSNASTWRSPLAVIGNRGTRVSAQAFVLPHKDRLSVKAYTDVGGPEGWSSQQGFYVYRGRRLLVAGSWLGLGRGRSWSKDEAHHLARICLDIPNSTDADWKIDVRKSSAYPPVKLREQLTRLAEDVRERARKVFLHRAQPSSPTGRMEDLASVWMSRETPYGRRYQIDRSHPAVRILLNHGGEVMELTENLLRVLEETIPVQRIWLETAETGELVRGGFSGEANDDVRRILVSLYRNLVIKAGMQPAQAKQKLGKTEPFDLHPELVSGLPEEISEL
ncbi:ATP-binding protein [Dickeya zeae]|uniref:ATP-binding protein n=1 Tax=Dickeya zeae TaxID=204042 RepID=UPI0003A9E544|nr:ATP-binding protein [Dickeya zeae]